MSNWCYDSQHNDIQHNVIQHNDIQHNDTQHNDTQYNNNNPTLSIITSWPIPSVIYGGIIFILLCHMSLW
jgi:hypothetical protein